MIQSKILKILYGAVHHSKRGDFLFSGMNGQ